MYNKNIQIMASSIGGVSNPVSIPPSLTKQEFEKFMDNNFSSYFSYYENEGEGNYSQELPKCKLPSFSGPSGNIAFLALSVSTALKEKGFNFESEIFFNDVIYNSSKERSFDAHYIFLKKASKYIDFGQPISWQEYQEIDNFFRAKGINSEIEAINFASNPTISYTQVPEFKNIDFNYKKLINDGFDFSTVNCYGRNALYYCRKAETFKYLVENTDVDPFSVDYLNYSLYNQLFTIIPDIGASEGLKYLLVLHSKFFDTSKNEHNYMQDLLNNNFTANQNIYLDIFPEFFFSTSDNNKAYLKLGTNEDGKVIYFNPIIKDIEAIYDSIELKDTKDLFISILDKALIKFKIETINKGQDENIKHFDSVLNNIEKKYMKEFFSSNSNQENKKTSKILKF